MFCPYADPGLNLYNYKPGQNIPRALRLLNRLNTYPDVSGSLINHLLKGLPDFYLRVFSHLGYVTPILNCQRDGEDYFIILTELYLYRASWALYAQQFYNTKIFSPANLLYSLYFRGGYLGDRSNNIFVNFYRAHFQ